MNYRAKPGSRTGSVSVPASKSYAHRLLIGFALSRDGGRIECQGISEDVKATIECLKALGAEITISEDRFIDVKPIDEPVGPADTGLAPVSLHCGESGSTLRFLLPVVGALGAKAVFHMEGRLPDRPFRELAEELAGHGMSIERRDNIVSCEGKLWSGDYTIPGNVSSQYVTGLLMALPLLEGDSTLTVTGEIQSADYIAITEDVLQSMEIAFHKEESTGNPVKYEISGGQAYNPQSLVSAERDWSGAAFFACMGALSEKGITLRDMPADSVQGDRKILDILKGFGAEITVSGSDDKASGRDITVRRGKLESQEIDVSQTPDILPEICIVAACCEGTTTITGAERLRFKESDRLKSMAGLLRELDVNVKETRTGLIINGTGKLIGGYGDPFGDHRIAMAAAVAATAATGDITITDAECVAKSYPGFWEDFDRLEIE